MMRIADCMKEVEMESEVKRGSSKIGIIIMEDEEKVE